MSDLVSITTSTTDTSVAGTLTIMIVLTDRAMLRMGSGAISET